MSGERGGENTSVEWEIHYCERWIVFLRQDAAGRTPNDCGFNRSSQRSQTAGYYPELFTHYNFNIQRYWSFFTPSFRDLYLAPPNIFNILIYESLA
jgi:hypothetical protein